MVTFEDFEQVDIRVGKVLEVKDFPEGKYSTHILKIDFGKEIGIKTSLARLAPNYQGSELVGKQVLGVVNFPPKQIGKYMSDWKIYVRNPYAWLRRRTGKCCVGTSGNGSSRRRQTTLVPLLTIILSSDILF